MSLTQVATFCAKAVARREALRKGKGEKGGRDTKSLLTPLHSLLQGLEIW